MSGGAGHVRDMQNREKQNRSMRASQRTKFKSNESNLLYAESEPVEWDFEEVSKEELEVIKEGIRIRAKKEQTKERLIILLMVIIIIATLWYLLA